MTTPTWRCRRCRYTRIHRGLLCAGCQANYIRYILDARHRNWRLRESRHNARLYGRHLAKHRRWVREGRVPQSVNM